MQFVHNAFIELDPSCSTKMGSDPICSRIIILGEITINFHGAFGGLKNWKVV